MQPEKVKEKKRNMSDNASNIRRRVAKLEIKHLLAPFRRPMKNPQMNRANVEEIKEANFDAWDFVDIFSSKHGIEEYIHERT
jgi:tRNA(Leu) C34 or U34 (ribose-2'-O)-methylase TrmL